MDNNCLAATQMMMCQQTRKCEKTMPLENLGATGVQSVLFHQCNTTPWVHTASFT